MKIGSTIIKFYNDYIDENNKDVILENIEMAVVCFINKLEE